MSVLIEIGPESSHKRATKDVAWKSEAAVLGVLDALVCVEHMLPAGLVGAAEHRARELATVSGGAIGALVHRELALLCGYVGAGPSFWPFFSKVVAAVLWAHLAPMLFEHCVTQSPNSTSSGPLFFSAESSNDN